MDLRTGKPSWEELDRMYAKAVDLLAARTAALEALEAKVLALKQHANEQGWQDVDDPIMHLLDASIGDWR